MDWLDRRHHNLIEYRREVILYVVVFRPVRRVPVIDFTTTSIIPLLLHLIRTREASNALVTPLGLLVSIEMTDYSQPSSVHATELTKIKKGPFHNSFQIYSRQKVTFK
ncbi:hypothetical protein EVAR_38848_1, partial [Eumeta japonica]